MSKSTTTTRISKRALETERAELDTERVDLETREQTYKQEKKAVRKRTAKNRVARFFWTATSAGHTTARSHREGAGVGVGAGADDSDDDSDDDRAEDSAMIPSSLAKMTAAMRTERESEHLSERVAARGAIRIDTRTDKAERALVKAVAKAERAETKRAKAESAKTRPTPLLVASGSMSVWPSDIPLTLEDLHTQLLEDYKEQIDQLANFDNTEQIEKFYRDSRTAFNSYKQIRDDLVTNFTSKHAQATLDDIYNKDVEYKTCILNLLPREYPNFYTDINV